MRAAALLRLTCRGRHKTTGSFQGHQKLVFHEAIYEQNCSKSPKKNTLAISGVKLINVTLKF